MAEVMWTRSDLIQPELLCGIQKKLYADNPYSLKMSDCLAGNCLCFHLQLCGNIRRNQDILANIALVNHLNYWIGNDIALFVTPNHYSKLFLQIDALLYIELTI